MRFMDDHRLAEAKRKDIAQIAEALGVSGLKRMGHELTGPCPRCGGTDRFNISTRKQQFLCRRCDAKGDGIGLVQFMLDCDFPAALDWLCGPKRELTPEERQSLEEAEAKAAEARKRTEAAQEKMRQESIHAGRKIWLEGLPAEDSPVRDYLARRGITTARLPELPRCLRFHPALPYMVAIRGEGWKEIHRGPAMLAAVQGADGRFSAVHRTWLDLDRAKGKAKIVHDGEEAAAKKSLGSTKGGSIRLGTPEGATTLIMAEGIETTLSAMVADAFPGAAYWAGVDLGNMAGRKVTGPGLKYAGIPDLSDERAFLPPRWVERLIFVMDGDSDPRFTEASVLAGLRRAMALRPGLRAQLVRAPEGADLNDLLMSGAAQ